MRLFIGIGLPEMIQQRLGLLSAGLFGARWVEPRNMHVTLRFIGEVSRGEAEDIDAALAAIRCPAFDLRLTGVGTFGSDRKVRQLWAGVERNEILTRLQQKVEQAVIRQGFEPEGRKFIPHVSLARFRGDPGERLGPYLEANNTFSAGPFTVEGFTLFESTLGGEGAHYEALQDYPLEGAPVEGI
jgi:2'-5' RNA ligase